MNPSLASVILLKRGLLLYPAARYLFMPTSIEKICPTACNFEMIPL